MAQGAERGSNHEQSTEQTQAAALVWLGLSVSIALLLLIIYYWKKKEKKRSNRLPSELPADAGAMRAELAGGVRRRPRTARQRMMTRREEDNEPEYSEEDEVNEDGAQLPWKDEEPSGKIGTKKMKKIQEKAEKKEKRELELQQREEKKKQDELKEEERKIEEERLKLEEEKEEEDERLKREEQERIEHEEYLMLKSAFTVEEEGEAGILSEQESQELLQDFIDFIKEKKVVMLEELASQFNLRVQEAIKRLEDLQEMGRLTGVMDDRGKFIHISEEELEKFARYVKQRGRVAISDLAEASNTLIALKGSKIDNENQNKTIEVS